jgi:hypothetical protein
MIKAAFASYEGARGPLNVKLPAGEVMTLPDPYQSFPPPRDRKVKLSLKEAKEIVSAGLEGVPQGAATSPILSNLIMKA